MTRRGDATRERIVDVAERLYAARGVDGVSLPRSASRRGSATSRRCSSTSAIATACCAPSPSGTCRASTPSRRGSRRSWLTRQRPTRAPARGSTWRCWSGLRPSTWRSARASGHGSRSRRRWAALPTLTSEDLLAHLTPVALDHGTALFEHLRPTLGDHLAAERLFAVGTSSLHLCADRARIEDAGGATRPLLALAQFADNLLDMAVGALLAPVGPPA
ncbi:MAG: hypothetical protein R2699_17475 [Acidimicrobiales bacterium]